MPQTEESKSEPKKVIREVKAVMKPTAVVKEVFGATKGEIEELKQKIAQQETKQEGQQNAINKLTSLVRNLAILQAF